MKTEFTSTAGSLFDNLEAKLPPAADDDDAEVRRDAPVTIELVHPRREIVGGGLLLLDKEVQISPHNNKASHSSTSILDFIV